MINWLDYRAWTQRQIIRQLTVSLIGVVAASGLAFAANILAGRVLGPSEYGRYAVMLAVAQIMVIVLLPGIDTAAMRYVARHKDEEQQKALYISAAVVLFTLTTVIGVSVMLVVRMIVPHVLPTVAGVYGMAMVYSLAVSQRNFHDAIARGGHRFRLQAVIRVAEAVTVLVVLSLLFWIGNCRSYTCYLTAGVAGAIMSICLYWPHTLGGVKWKVSGQYMRRMWQYGKFGVIGATAGIMQTSVDRLLIVRELGAYDLGFYTAYYVSSVMIAVQLGTVLANVLFPVAAGRRDHAGMLQQLDKYFLFGFLPVVGAGVVVIYLALKLFGSAYIFDGKLALLMSGYAFTSVAVSVYVNVISSAGKAYICMSMWNMFVAGCLYLAVLYIILPDEGVYAPGLAALGSFVYMVIVRVVMAKKRNLFLYPDNVV